MKLRGQSNVWYQKHGEYRRMLFIKTLTFQYIVDIYVQTI